MKGMSATTGKSISGLDRLRQSVEDILTTPIGSRVERRDYGSKLFLLIDKPVNAGWLVDLYAYTAEALDKWEPEFSLSQVKVASVDAGHPTIDLYGTYLIDGQPVAMEGIVI